VVSFSWFVLHELAQGAFGVMQAGFHRAERHGGDGGDFFEGKIFEHVEQKRGALRGGKFFHEDEKRFGVFGADERVARVVERGVGEIVGVVVGVGEEIFVAAFAAELLHAALVGDAEEPRGELGVVAERGDVAHGVGEGFLHEVQRGVAVAGEFGDVGEERQLMLLEERVPGLSIVTAGGLDEVGELFGHEGHSLSGMLNAAKGSMERKEFSVSRAAVVVLERTRSLATYGH
jgi:hypothetical protein